MKTLFSNYSVVMKTENISVMRFQSENSVFKILRGYEDGKHFSDAFSE